MKPALRELIGILARAAVRKRFSMASANSTQAADVASSAGATRELDSNATGEAGQQDRSNATVEQPAKS